MPNDKDSDDDLNLVASTDPWPVKRVVIRVYESVKCSSSSGMASRQSTEIKEGTLYAFLVFFSLSSIYIFMLCPFSMSYECIFGEPSE